MPIRPLIVLHRDELLRAHLRTAGRREFDMRCVDSWSDLHAAARSTQAIPVVVVDPYAGASPTETAGDAGGPAPALRTFLREFPYVPVVAALETRPARFRDIRTLGSWGISEIVSLDQETLGEAVAQRLREVAGKVMKSLLGTVLPPSLGFRAHEVMAAAADAVTSGGGGDAREVARALFISRRTLSRRCADSGLPPPRRLLAWMRVLLACELLDDPRRTVGNIAFVCGYSSDNALRLALTTFLARTPRELRQAGALTTATRAFRHELGEYRVVA